MFDTVMIKNFDVKLDGCHFMSALVAVSVSFLLECLVHCPAAGDDLELWLLNVML